MNFSPNDKKPEILEQMLDYHTTSYKLYWLYGIFIELEQGKLEITFREAVTRMITCCWYSLLKFKLQLGVIDMLNNLVVTIANRFNLSSDILEEELYDFLLKLTDPDIERQIAEFYRYVPYRLLQPFFKRELLNQLDHKKNCIIEDCALKSQDVFYKIYSSEQKIVVSEDWAAYIDRNRAIINGWINSKLINFLQKKNPSIPGIPMKIIAPRVRDLSTARKFWSIMLELNQSIDIYTGHELTRDNFLQYGNLSIDHFIPWSFVLHDQMWNLVPTFRDVNSAKNDKLPPLEPFLDRFCNLQYLAFCTTYKYERLRKYAEDYVAIDNILHTNLLTSSLINETVFVQVIKRAIVPLYQIAQNQGFELWVLP